MAVEKASSSNNMFAITTTCDEKLEIAHALAKRLNLAFVGHPASENALKFAYLLVYTPNFLGIQKTSDKKPNPFHIDFLSGKMLYRSKQAGLRRELLAKCIGLKPSDNPYIVDATAGLGRDSYILATLGFNVTLIEQSPIVHALLEDALSRARENSEIKEVADRLTLIQADSVYWLQNTSPCHAPDVIYLDPMFPERKKSASVKKEMVILHNLLLNGSNDEALFLAATACATKRVVVKRPRLAANIVARSPNFSMAGKNSRFDVYLCNCKG